MMVLRPWSAEGRSDHLRIGILVSVLIHAAVLGLKLPDSARAPAPQEPLRITLANARTEAPPLRPRALAQASLDGGGEAAPTEMATSPLPRTTELDSPELVLKALRKRQQELEKEQQRLYAQLHAARKAPAAGHEAGEPARSLEPGQDEDDQDSLILNARIAAIDERIRQYNAMPRQLFDAPSTAAADYAQYLEAWRRKIEILGTEHYPAEGRQKLYGSLQMTVYIRTDGQLDHVEIDRPSSEPALNLAAHRIVQLAAPFPPLPPSIAGQTDILAITRTWHFINNRLDTTGP